MPNNALQHGCTSEKLLLPDENAAEYEVLLEGLIENYRPETPLHRRFVYEAARAIWILERNNRRYDEMEQALFVEQRDSTKWTEEQARRLDLRMRYRTTAERSCTRALKNLEHIRKNWVQETKKPEVKAQPKPAQTETQRTIRETQPPTLHQRLITTETDGQRTTAVHPTNEQLLRVVSGFGADRLAGVIRVYEYPEGREFWRSIRMSVEEWLKQIETEGEIDGGENDRA